MRRQQLGNPFLMSRRNMLKSIFVLVAIAGWALLHDHCTFGEEPGHEHAAPRRPAWSVPPKPAPQPNPDAKEPAKPGADDEQPAAIDPVSELRRELKRMQAEIDRLKRQQRMHAPDDQPASFDGSESLLQPLDDTTAFGDAAEDSPAFGPSGFQLDDEPAPDEGPFGEIRPVQHEESPAEFGATPGQRLRPRRTDELGSIGLPAMPEYKPNMPARKRKVEAEFREGIRVKTDDDYFSLTFHNLTQVDFRGFVPAGDPLHDSFIIPRQRWYLIGNISPFVRYYTVINRGYGTLDILDAWTDWSIAGINRDKLQIRMGRMKTPYTYEYIKIAENDLIAAERSVFVSNMAGNRQIGIMAHGELANREVEYAVGLFNGPRRSFEDFNDGKDLFTFINTRPFLNGDDEVLKQLNIGGSWNWGNQHNPAQPFALRTANDQSTSPAASNVSPTFFRFGENVFEAGTRMQWSGDIAYYYKSMGILAGYQGGFQDYAIAGKPPPSVQELRVGTGAFAGVNAVGPSTRVPMTGYSIAVFYFVTGEEITRRVELLEPRNEYAASRFWQGNIGAIELFSRFAFMSLGSNVFTAGLADPAISTNRANVLDNGFNWYLNHYTKLTFEWQYSAYGSPVFLTPTTTTSFNNLFWFRTQVFF